MRLRPNAKLRVLRCRTKTMGFVGNWFPALSSLMWKKVGFLRWMMTKNRKQQYKKLCSAMTQRVLLDSNHWKVPSCNTVVHMAMCCLCNCSWCLSLILLGIPWLGPTINPCFWFFSWHSTIACLGLCCLRFVQSMSRTGLDYSIAFGSEEVSLRLMAWWPRACLSLDERLGIITAKKSGIDVRRIQTKQVPKPNHI